MEDTVEFSYPADAVFAMLPTALGEFKAMKIVRSNELTRRIEVNVSMNWTSWGETVVITVTPKSDSSSVVRIQSHQRLFSMTGRRQQITHQSEIFETLARKMVNR